MFYKEDDWIVMTFWNSLFIAFFLLPLGINLPSPFFIASMIFGLIMMFKFRKKFVLEKSALLFPMYFVMLAFGLLYSENLSGGLDLVQRSISLLLFPVIFMFVKEDSASVRRLFDFLLIGLIVSFIANVVMASQSLIAYVCKNEEINGFFSFLEVVTRDWSYFFIGSSFSGSVNSNYISIYILLVLGYYLKNELESRIQFVVVGVLFIYLFLLASIGAYIILAMMSVLLIFNVTDKSKKYLLIIIFAMGVVLFLHNPRVATFYHQMKSYSSVLEKVGVSSEKSRLLSWNASTLLIKDAPLFGYGSGDANNVLFKKYEELGYFHNLKHRYNAHNQYLQSYLQTGFIGFAILISIFIVLAMRLKRSRNEFSVFLILFVSLLFESMLVRFNGIVFFSIITPLLLKRRSILSSRIIRN
ncbi:O-antigen ligase family protein [Aquimarina sp. 2201CG1-2-11]|uniref:O-antigen ligase family protein n=1 Tax=Aquimarina discodermiae TaxID=3231043 RepID=UPI003461E6EB